MSVDGTKLLFEGFLQKRKDTLKLRWVTYWFRLQNTTLFFYTQKNGSASHLRGNYYIYSVQSVREVHRADSKRFMFEIIMTNGKKKMLAAETAALRQEWVGHLWQAMHLSTSGVSESVRTHPEVHEQRERTITSTPVCSCTESVMESLPARPLSAPVPTDHIQHEIRGITCPIYLPEQQLNSEETTYEIPLPPICHYRHHNDDGLNSDQWFSGLSNGEAEEGDYDVLPVRKNICEINASAETNEDVYDTPLSYRLAAEHPEPTESIYDVPSSLLRKVSDESVNNNLAFGSGEQLEDGPYWRI